MSRVNPELFGMNHPLFVRGLKSRVLGMHHTSSCSLFTAVIHKLLAVSPCVVLVLAVVLHGLL